MNTTKKLAVCFALLGALLLGAAGAVSFCALDAPVRLLMADGGAEKCTEEFMNALAGADHDVAEGLLYGNPELPSAGEMESGLEKRLWEAYEGSITYTFSGECYASDSGICRDVEVTALDLPAVLGQLKEQSQSLLEQRAAETEWDIAFDENGQYREAFAMAVLEDCAGQLVEAGAPTGTVRLTLELVCREGTWYVLPNKGLAELLSGGMGE